MKKEFYNINIIKNKKFYFVLGERKSGLNEYYRRKKEQRKNEK